MPPAPGQQAIEHAELSRLFGYVVQVRLAILPVLAGLVLWLAWVEPAPWRRALLLALAVFLNVFFFSEWFRFRRRGLAPGAVTLNLVVAVIGHLFIVGASGGLASPFLYLMVPFALISATFLRAGVRLGLLGAQLAGVWGFAAIAVTGAIPEFNLSVFGGGARPGGPAAYVWAHAVGLSAVLGAVNGLGLGLRISFERTVRGMLTAQQDSLRTHAERAEELTALSAEIAHELKNPLASVKGLAGLLEGSVPEGKPAERLSVLRREVDRMQAILDEFLNFSRPLVPLALGDADVWALCREVAALHEGIARERGVDIELRGEEVRARCDPRKVKQILINLVQNALEASPSGGAVELETAETPAGARVRVLDRGRGPDLALGEAVFSPGVTTKPRGSGLGLTIARALARQHGGDLALAARPGGGATAELTLPSRPAEPRGTAGAA
jgi:signal transduction histidine kinase